MSKNDNTVLQGIYALTPTQAKAIARVVTTVLRAAEVNKLYLGVTPKEWQVFRQGAEKLLAAMNLEEIAEKAT